MNTHDVIRGFIRSWETHTITELDVLADRILADLPDILDTEELPASIDCGIRVVRTRC